MKPDKEHQEHPGDPVTPAQDKMPTPGSCVKGDGGKLLQFREDKHLNPVYDRLLTHGTLSFKQGIILFVFIQSVDLDSLRFEPWKVTNANLKGLQHIGVAVKDIARATERFAALFSLKAVDLRTDQHYGTQKDMMIEPGNDRLWLHLVETTDPENRVTKFMQEHDAGLEHLCFEMGDIRQAVKQVQAAGVPLFQSKIYLDRDDGFEAFVYPQYNHGVTVELIEPYPDSRGYRQCP